MDSEPIKYYRIQGRAWCVVGGDRLSISGFECFYDVDDIASARIYLSVGREMRGAQVTTISDSLEVLSSIQPVTPVTIYAHMSAEPADAEVAPEGKDDGFPTDTDPDIGFPVFMGYIAGPELSREFQSSTAGLCLKCFGE